MTAIFDCGLKPSELNNQIRQFMSDIALQCREVKAISFVFEKSIAAALGTVCYADRDFMADASLAPYWQLADGGAAQGDLKSVLGWQTAPNLLGVFLEIAQAPDWARAGSNNKKHRHYFELTGETNRQTAAPLWRGYIPKARQHHSDTTLSRGIAYSSRDFEVVNPHSHRVFVQAEGGDEFRPDYVRFAPFICHTAMR